MVPFDLIRMSVLIGCPSFTGASSAAAVKSVTTDKVFAKLGDTASHVDVRNSTASRSQEFPQWLLKLRRTRDENWFTNTAHQAYATGGNLITGQQSVVLLFVVLLLGVGLSSLENVGARLRKGMMSCRRHSLGAEHGHEINECASTLPPMGVMSHMKRSASVYGSFSAIVTKQLRKNSQATDFIAGRPSPEVEMTC